MDLEQLIGKTTEDEFIQGLLMSRNIKSPGDIWEKCVECTSCLFAKQCQTISDILEDQNKNPTCGQIINLLMGNLKPEEIK
ncbi:MAG: hypothetical protein IJV71_07050 [Lachnospiraceae bacterium]|nr:hypothetical protein [Lachnospiraceae bacterium]